MRILPFLFLISQLSCFAQLNSSFSSEQVLSDLKTLRMSLEEVHYNMYAYTSKDAIDSIYNNLKSSVNEDSLTLLKTINLYQELVSSVNNGHTEIDFPAQSYLTYADSGGTILPIEIAFESGKALIRKNWSDDKSLQPGTQVIRINDMTILEILDAVSPQISAERPYFKNTKIELYSLPRLYWQVFGEQQEFVIETLSEGKSIKHSVKPVKVLEGYEYVREEILNAQMKLKFLNEAAYLNPGNFSGDENKYRTFIDSSFLAVNQKGASNLIIDLRNNGGGDNSFSDYLVSYIADKPFKWCSNFTLKTSNFLKEQVRQTQDTTSAYWSNVLIHEDGEVYPFDFEPYEPQPQEKRYKGAVYVLVNRQSHSQSAVTAAQIQDYHFGTIVGEETGDYPSLYASQFTYTLPVTGIPVKVSKGYMVRVNGSTESRGVLPDIFIKDHLLDEEDEILDGLLNKINTDD